MKGLRKDNYLCRSNLKELEIQNETDVDIMEKIKRLTQANNSINGCNNKLKDTTLEMQQMFGTMAEVPNEVE